MATQADWLQQLGAVMPADQAQINTAVLADGTPSSIAAPQIPQAPQPMPQAMQSPVMQRPQTPPPPAAAQMSSAFNSYLPKPSSGSQADQTNAYGTLSKQALSDQAAAVSGLNQYIDDMAAKPTGLDLSALAAYVDSTTGSKLYDSVHAAAPMSQEAKDQMLFGLKNKAAQDQAKLSADQLKALQEQQAQEQYLRHEQELERHNQAMENKSNAGADAQLIRAQTMQGNQNIGVVKMIHDDSVLKTMRGQAAQVDKGLEIMNNPHVSSKALHEVAQDFAAALSPKSGGSDYKLQSLMTPSAQEQLNNLNAYATSDPDQPAPAAQVKFWKDFGTRLQGTYDTQLPARAQGKLAGLQTATKLNPTAYQAAKEAADLYKDGNWRMLEGLPKPGTMVQPPHGQTVKQNGKTYEWNGHEYLEAK